MKNKKGFTLVELLAVIALLALLTGIAVPNIISTINNNKRQEFIVEAKRMISKAKSFVAANKTDRDNLKTTPVVYTFLRLNSKDEFQTDADGQEYDQSSYVKVTYDKDTKKYNYCICLLGSKRKIGSKNSCNPDVADDCVNSEELDSIDIVKDR